MKTITKPDHSDLSDEANLRVPNGSPLDHVDLGAGPEAVAGTPYVSALTVPSGTPTGSPGIGAIWFQSDDGATAPTLRPAVEAANVPVQAATIPSGASVSNVRANSDGSISEAVSFVGSDVAFNNTFASGLSQAYINCALAAEQTIAAQWSSPNAVVLNESFTAQAPGQNGQLASNGFYVLGVSYATLKSTLTTLASHEPGNTYLQQAVAHLPASDPSGGMGFELALPYARMLGLTSASNSPDDAVTLNTSYNWNYGQDVTNTLVHEITEGGLGRIGGLGDQNSLWSVMDLFRYNSSGAADYTDGRDGRTTYFSDNGGATLSSLSYNNEYNGGTKVNGGDTADFTQVDVFGTGFPGETNGLSQIDIQIMEALGWSPSSGAILNSPFEGDPSWTVVGVGDFTSDGKSDLVYYNAPSGFTEIQFQNGITNSGGGLIANSPFEGDRGWTVVGVGDFNGDGKSDLVYHNAATGFTELQFQNGITNAGGGLIPNSPFEGQPGWTVVGVGDFNGDGKSDLVYYNAPTGFTELQFQNGITNAGGGLIASSPFEGQPGWTVVGVGDFNGDGKSDLVYYNAHTATTEIQFQNGITNAGGGLIANSPFEGQLGWTVVGVGDFNGDGKSDLVYYNAAAGLTEIQLQNGVTNAGGGEIVNNSFEHNPDWMVVGTGDFNGDGKSDLVYYDAKTGTTSLVFLNGNVAISSATTTSNATAISLHSSNASAPTTIAVGATLEIDSNQSRPVSFSGTTGKLIIDAPASFSGQISNFAGDGTLTGSDQIDLRTINFISVQESFSNGVLTVTDGAASARLDFIGSYTLENFKFASDGEGGTLVYDPPVSSGEPVSKPIGGAEFAFPPISSMGEVLLDLLKPDLPAPAAFDGGHAQPFGAGSAAHIGTASFDAVMFNHYNGGFLL